METKEYHTDDKASWGAGPWQLEPDKRQWADAATGMPCLIVRNQLGSLCGYVGVPTSHPLHSVDYDGSDAATPALKVAVCDLLCHGGLTYAAGCAHTGDESMDVCHVPGAGEPDDVWWFGFDCGHFMDKSPRLETLRKVGLRLTGTYRNLAYVTSECTDLARQLAALTPPALQSSPDAAPPRRARGHDPLPALASRSVLAALPAELPSQ